MMEGTIQRRSMQLQHLTHNMRVANWLLHHSIIFVHGLGGHPKRTWSTEPYEPKASAERDKSTSKFKTNLRRLLPLKKKEEVTEGVPVAAKTPPPSRGSEISIDAEVFWPRDLLPNDVNDVRVMTFGYYSNPAGSSQDNLYTLSKNLLGKIANERTSAVCYLVCFRCEFTDVQIAASPHYLHRSQSRRHPDEVCSLCPSSILVCVIPN